MCLCGAHLQLLLQSEQLLLLGCRSPGPGPGPGALGCCPLGARAGQTGPLQLFPFTNCYLQHGIRLGQVRLGYLLHLSGDGLVLLLDVQVLHTRHRSGQVMQ